MSLDPYMQKMEAAVEMLAGVFDSVQIVAVARGVTGAQETTCYAHGNGSSYERHQAMRELVMKWDEEVLEKARRNIRSREE